MSDDGPTISPAFLASTLPVVLVGGRSRRYGRDKLVEPWNGKMLVEHPIDALRSVFGNRVKVVGACDPRIPGLADGVIQDRYACVGPIGGITSALESGHAPIFVLAGDMPSVSRLDILAIVAAAERSRNISAVVGFTDRFHPCLGMYLATALPLLLAQLDQKKYCLSDAVPSSLVLRVAVEERSVVNINEPTGQIHC